MDSKSIKSILGALMVVGCLAAFAPFAAADEGCKLAASNASLHDQLITLSNLIDPSGKLTMLIEQQHPGEHQHSGAVNVTEQHKRSPVADQATTESGPSSTLAPVSLETTAGPSSAPITEEPAPKVSSNSSSAPPEVSEPAKVSTTPAPKTTPLASNVTVNVFLQLVPDAKTEELINNPNNLNMTSSTSAQPEVSSTQTTPTAMPAAPAVNSSEPVTISTTATMSSTATVSTTIAPAPARRRRRRSPLMADAPAAASQAPNSTTDSGGSIPAGSLREFLDMNSNYLSSQAPEPAKKAETTTPAAMIAVSTNAPTPKVAVQQLEPMKASTTQATVEIAASELANVTQPSAPTKTPLEIVITISDSQKSATTIPLIRGSTTITTINSSEPVIVTSTPSPSLSAKSVPEMTSSAPSTTSTTSTTTSSAPSTTSTTSTTTSSAPSTTSTTSTTTTTTTTTTTPQPSSTFTPINKGTSTVSNSLADLSARLASFGDRALDPHSEGRLAASPTPVAPLGSALSSLTPEEPSSRLDKSAAALGQAGGSLSFDNLNVIYDNDTTIVELTSTAAPKLPNNSACAGSDEAPLPARFNKTKMADFYDSDRTEAELLEQRDNFATCLLEPPLEGRLNFWQPVNNAGVMHALFRFRSTKPAHSISRRESFRAPIERAPHDGLVTLAPLGPRNKVWLSELDNCSDFERRSTKVNRKLLAEVSGNIEQPGAIDVDAELIVAHFNLTGTNAITERQLVIESAQGTMIACCRVIRSDRMPSSELDNLPSVSVVQPTREHLLPDKLRQTN